MRRSDKLERKFALFWQACGGSYLEPEYRFHPVRKWRFDFAETDKKVAFEIHGGIWIGGRHQTASGFMHDCEKYTAAAMLGWRIIHLTSQDITTPKIQELANWLHACGLG